MNNSVLVSSVIRGAEHGDSHGGLYRVDFSDGACEQLLDWNDSGIDFDGRGADRGLRGIVIHGEEIFIAASDELFLFDKEFRILNSWRCPALKHCHEMSLWRGAIYLTSTGFDSILRFDLRTRAFDLGLRLHAGPSGYSVAQFDPNAAGVIAPSAGMHLNNVHVDESGYYASGLKIPALIQFNMSRAAVYAEIPMGSHNARPFRGGVILNDTDNDQLVWFSPDDFLAFPTPSYPDEELRHRDVDKTGVARQAFGRGLCFLSDTLIAGGSSPTTVSLYDLAARRRISSVNLTMDVRNAAHGLAPWPF